LYEDLLDPEYSTPDGFNDDGYDAVYSTDNEEVKEAETVSRNKLSPLARRRFKAMLRAMAGKRGEVARCMAFCLEHGEAAAEVSNIVISSLLVNSTPVPRKIARLHLISDIVHNSAVALPSAWKYRQELQQRLGLVFDHLSTIYHSFSGRMTAETFKRQVVAVVDVWDDRIVFPPDQTLIWKERLDGKEVVKAPTVDIVEEVVVQQAPSASKFKLAFKPIADPEGEEDMELDDDDEPSKVETAAGDRAMHVDDEDLDGAPIVDEDVDGEALDEDIDGAPLDDLDGAPLDDLDGEPLDLDGEGFQ
jgi:U2-associated protein SR140